MKIKILLFANVLNTLVAINTFSQKIPFVYDVENTGAKCAKPALPSFSELPALNQLPDPFRWSDGHGHCPLPDSQRPEVIAFVEKFLLWNKTANTNISVSPYNTDTSPWIS